MGNIALGDPIPIAAQLDDGATDLYARARLYNGAFTELPASPVALAHFAQGLYKNTDVSMPSTTSVYVAIKFYTDAGFTTLAEDRAQTMERFDLLQSSGGGGGENSGLGESIIGYISSDEIVGEVEDCS